MPTPPPFDWMEPSRNPARGKIDQAAREAMYRDEIEERARLLHRLGRGREQIRSRLLANLEWDFAPGPSPLAPAAIEGILDRVFGQPTAAKPGQRKR